MNRESLILKTVAKGRGADIGCGSRKISQNCIGVDLTPKGEKGKFGCEKNKTSVADFSSSGDNLSMFCDEELDFIVSKHNLEHYEKPEQTIREWKRVLKKGGVVGVIVPDDKYVNSLKLDSTHRVNFNLDNIEELFRKAGFKIVKKGTAVKHWSIYIIAKKLTADGKNQ
jgi:predicted SAM-dependent methyltransferase